MPAFLPPCPGIRLIREDCSQAPVKKKAPAKKAKKEESDEEPEAVSSEEEVSSTVSSVQHADHLH